MLLVLSVEELASNPAKNPPVLSAEVLASNPVKKDELKFTGFMDKIFAFSEDNIKCFKHKDFEFSKDNNRDFLINFNNAIILLKELKSKFEANPLAENRTNWIEKITKREEEIIKLEEKNAAYMATYIVDLCYNCTVEESILNISKHYEKIDNLTFKNDFIFRLFKYWKSFKVRSNISYFSENVNVSENDIAFPEWEMATRVIKLNRNRKKNNLVNDILLYEQNYSQEARAWKLQIIKSMLISFGAVIVYIAIFVASSFGINCFQNIIHNITDNIPFSPFMYSIMSIVVFSIISALISKLFKIPDILESIKNVFVWVTDIVKIITSRKKVSHNNNAKE